MTTSYSVKKCANISAEKEKVHSVLTTIRLKSNHFTSKPFYLQESWPRFYQVITTVVKISFRPDVAIENQGYCQTEIKCVENALTWRSNIVVSEVIGRYLVKWLGDLSMTVF